MQIEDNLTKISNILNNHGIILYPADGIWGIACNAKSNQAISKIRKSSIELNPYHEILVSDILMLKTYAYRLHPRIETLLSYHNRPIKLLIEKTQQLPLILSTDQEPICFRIVKDKWSRRLIHTFGGPLYVHSFVEAKSSLPLPAREIRRLKLPALDFMSDFNSEIRTKNTHYDPILLASYDEEGFITIH